jgi:hypothetical protein
MATLTNLSDQFGFFINVVSSRGVDWTSLQLGFQYYVEQLNTFQVWVQGSVDIYDTDAKCLKRLSREFATVHNDSKNFAFTPEVEPSFTFSGQRVPHNEDYCRVFSLGIDLKQIVRIGIPSAYREDRIELRFHTDEPRLQAFIATLLSELDGIVE